MSDMAEDDAKRNANLARIRDNQRRSRARRKEYLSELEQKYRTCEQLGVEASAEIQAAARKVLEENKAVVDENRRLRQLLVQHGLTENEVDGWLERPQNPQYPSHTTVALESLIGRRIQCAGQAPCSSGGAASDRRQSCGPSLSTQPLQVHQLLAPSQPSPHSSVTSSLHSPNLAPYPPSQNAAYGTTAATSATSLDFAMPYDDIFTWDENASAPPGTRPSDSSSCFVAADAIRAIKPDIGYELETELGCAPGKECSVPNSQIFGIMDRFTMDR